MCIRDRFKDRQLHMEDYLQMESAEQKEYAEVSVYQRITENNDIITDFRDVYKRQGEHCPKKAKDTGWRYSVFLWLL